MSSYGDANVDHKDVHVLKNGNWLHDELILAWMEYLRRALQARPMALNDDIVAYVSPNVAAIIASTDNMETIVSSVSAPLKLAERHVMFIPLNDGLLDGAGSTSNYDGTHWTLLVFCRGAGWVEFDSLRSSPQGDERPSESAKVVAAHLSKSVNLPPSDSSVRLLPSPRQQNASDCGAYVCATMEKLLNDFNAGNMSAMQKGYTDAEVPEIAAQAVRDQLSDIIQSCLEKPNKL